MVQSVNLDGSKWNDEDIVIAGISARLPNCDSVEEFQTKLLDKVDLITDEPRRFQSGLYGAIKRYGLLKDLSKFDAKFFNIHPKQAERMDPQIRNLLEVAYEATVDAGLHPEDLKGTRTGVVVGVASSETQDKWSQMPDRINGYEYIGCTRTMFANRVSYYLDIKGPSYSIDTASSTTLVAFQQAYDLIKDGVCDACFVCGTDLVLNPCVCLMFQCLNMLSPEGKCKAFDIGGDGYVRSEGVVAVLLQKAKNAKRVYANVMAAGSNCDGYKDEGITFPSGAQQVKLFRRVAQLAEIDPSTIDFMEAHGSATRVGDPQEMNAVTEVFTTGRKGALRTGSIKSNMGHGEPASALSAVIKVCVAMECGIIPPNLHYHTPNPDIPALLDGRLDVITEPTPWTGGLVAVNSFGVGGANGHALLLSNKKAKHIVPDTIPRLICVSGVTKSAVETMLNKIQSLMKDPELYALLHNIHRKNIKGHEYRGFMIENEKKIEKTKSLPRKNFCIVLPGIETKWQNVDQSIINMETFQTSLKNSEKELKSVLKSINLTNVLKTLGQEKSPLNLVIGVTALQIGLIDTLNALDLVPDFIVGLNIGEIAAGYAAKSYSQSQAILSAYHIGNILQRSYSPCSIVESDMPRKLRRPAGVSVCNKISAQVSHFTGSNAAIKEFTRIANEKGYHVKELNSFAIDHQSILQDTANVSKLKNDLDKVLGTSKNGSKKWLVNKIRNANQNLTGGEFLIQNLIISSRIPQKSPEKSEDIIYLQVGCGNCIETSSSESFSLLSDNASISQLLSAIGELYNAGLQPQVQNLYPKVQFPVSHGTPMIQSMIEWDHSEKWNVVSFAPKDGRVAGEFDVVVDFDKAEFSFLPKNLLNKREVFPKSFYIYLVWKTMSHFQNKPMSDFPLVIENMFFTEETYIPDDGPVKFTINIIENSGKFEIRESRKVIACGQVQIPVNVKKEQIPSSLFETADFQCGNEDIPKSDVYRNLSIKQYQYNDTFQQIQSSNTISNTFKAKNFNWCSIFEAFLQVSILCSTIEENSHSVVSYIRKITIDPSKYEQDQVTAIKYHKKLNVLKSSSIEIRGMKLNEKPTLMPVQPAICSEIFVPFNSQLSQAAEASLIFALENWIGQTDLKVAEIIDSLPESLLSSKIQNANPLIKIDITAYSKDSTYVSEKTFENVKLVNKDISEEPVDNNCHIIIASNVLSNEATLDNIVASIRTDGCILLEEDLEETFKGYKNLECISSLSSDKKLYLLLKKVNANSLNLPRVMTVSTVQDCAQKLNQLPDGNALVIARDSDIGGIEKYVKCIMRSEQNQSLKAIFIEDKTTPVFSISNELYAAQLKKNYPINVYKNGTWGSYIALSLPKDTLVPAQDAFFGIDYTEDTTDISLVASNSAIYKQPKQPWEVACSVNYASLNGREHAFYHRLLCPKFSHVDEDYQKYQMGVEFSGYEGSRRVFGLVVGGALSTSVIADKDFLWTVPKNWSLEDACTVPGPYSSAFYTFGVQANLRAEDSVLIVGDSSLSMAAIQIALARNANVYILVQEIAKKLELAKHFPQVKSNQIIVSKNDNFYLQILQSTEGKGVNYVFVTIPVETYKFQSYINSLAENGKFFYYNREQRSHEEVLGSTGNMRCISFYRITPSTLFENSSMTLRKKISELMNDGLKTGAVKPLPYTVLAPEDIAQAFTKQEDESNSNKFLIKIREESTTPTSSKMFSAKARVYFDSQKYYIISGGFGDFGGYVSDWMVKQGARNLVLVTTELGAENQPLFKILNEKWKSLNCSVSIAKANDFSLRNCENIVQNVKKLGPVGGVFDFTDFKVEGIDENIEDERTMKKYLAHKLDFLTNMDAVTRKLCPTMEYLVSFSSIEFEFAPSTESLLCFANGKIKNLIRNRKSSNLSAKYIQWGPIGESSSEIIYNKSISDIPAQSLSSSLQMLHALLTNPEPIVASFIISSQSTEAGESKVDAIMEGVAKFLGIKDPSTVLPNLTMLELGLDSLIGTDIQQFLEINYGVIMSTQEVRELSFDKLRILAESL